ncbi:unnamed protein product [Prunus armeniaca]|uniref:Uncharacterized protein n=1 Tax=Prunus armeniaca TaxID=36596 RepID=A0A6J5VVR7_PRUAR|nr:unnamed protein product [Prunus armeniaca]
MFMHILARAKPPFAFLSENLKEKKDLQITLSFKAKPSHEAEALLLLRSVSGDKMAVDAAKVLQESVRNPTSATSRKEEQELCIKQTAQQRIKHTFLGLLAKIKCSICSYQFNI